MKKIPLKREGSFYEKQILSPKWRQLKGMPIEALGFSSKTYNILAFKLNGIRTLTHIRMLDMYELSRMEGVGDKTIEELKYVLKVWK